MEQWKQSLYQLWKMMGFDAETVAEYERILFRPINPSMGLVHNAMWGSELTGLLWLENAGIHQIEHTVDEYLAAWWHCYGMDEHGQKQWFAWDEVIERLRDTLVGSKPCVFWNQMDATERHAWRQLPKAFPRTSNRWPIQPTFTLFRGIGVPQSDEPLTEGYDVGISWTDSLETAQWFAKRYKSETVNGYVLECKFTIHEILGVKLGRNEREFLVDPGMVMDVSVTQV